MKRLIFGCGYLGLRVARRWLAMGDDVTVVTRSAERAAQLSQEGLRPIVADVTSPASLAGMPATDTLLFAVGHDRSAGPSIHEVYAAGLQNVLRAAQHAERVIYISTTGVYGPANGDWVDEQTSPNPQRDGGRASLAAEDALWASPLASHSVALRLAGIYGPGRVPFLKQLAAGEPIAAPAAGWLNLIHVDDAAEVVVRAAGLENVSQLYCVSDGAPVLRGDYYAEAARRIVAAPPKFVDPPEDSPRAARARADKRIANARMLVELSPRLAFPDYRSGLASVLGNRGPSG